MCENQSTVKESYDCGINLQLDEHHNYKFVGFYKFMYMAVYT